MTTADVVAVGVTGLCGQENVITAKPRMVSARPIHRLAECLRLIYFDRFGRHKARAAPPTTSTRPIIQTSPFVFAGKAAEVPVGEDSTGTGVLEADGAARVGVSGIAVAVELGSEEGEIAVGVTVGEILVAVAVGVGVMV